MIIAIFICHLYLQTILLLATTGLSMYDNLLHWLVSKRQDEGCPCFYVLNHVQLSALRLRIEQATNN